MKYILLLALLCLIIGCSKNESTKRIDEPNEQILQEISDIQKSIAGQDLTTKLTNTVTVGIEDALELKDICDKIMEIMGNGDIQQAIEEMKKYSWLPDSEMDNLYLGTQKQMDLVKNRFGELIGYEFVIQQLISKSLVRFIYLAKCENHTYVWYFMFYKAKDKWTLNSINWNDQIQNIPY